MEVCYELTPRDFYDAFLTHRNRSSLSKLPFWILSAATILLLALDLLAVVMRPGRLTLGELGRGLALALCWIIILWAHPWWKAKRDFSRQPSAKGPRTDRFDADGVHTQWRGGCADLEWRTFVRVLEGKKVFLLYTSPTGFRVVPKRVFAPEKLTEFNRLLRENLKSTQ